MHFCCAADSQLADVSEIPASTLPSHHIKHLITTKYLLLIYSIFIGKTEYIFKDQEDISLKWLLNLITEGVLHCMHGRKSTPIVSHRLPLEFLPLSDELHQQPGPLQVMSQSLPRLQLLL